MTSMGGGLNIAAVKGQALDLCQELFLADGTRSYEEDAVKKAMIVSKVRTDPDLTPISIFNFGRQPRRRIDFAL